MPDPHPRRLVAAAALAAVAPALAACTDANDVVTGGPLRGLPSDEGVGITVRDADRAPTWHVGALIVCVEDDEPVTIRSVNPNLIGDVELVAAGAKTLTSSTAGTMPGALPPAYAPADGFQVTGSCADDQWTELAVELSVPPSGSGGMDGFTIHYSRGDQEYRVGYAAQVLLCRGEDAGADPELLAACAEGSGEAAP